MTSKSQIQMILRFKSCFFLSPPTIYMYGLVVGWCFNVAYANFCCILSGSCVCVDYQYTFSNTWWLSFWLLGIYIINLGKTWEKLQLAARVIVGIENPQDIIVQSARPYGQRAVLKFAQYTGAHAIAGRHTPGTFTNQLQTSFSEPRLLILTDPRTDHQVNTAFQN